MGERDDRLKLFVGGLSRETSDVELRDHFSKYGEVNECVVAHDRETGERRGFGFVTFSHSDAFLRALQDCHVILKRRVDVKKAIPRNEQLRNKHHSIVLSNNRTSNNHHTSRYDQCSTKKIFVGGLSPSVTENEFKSYFEQFGKITDVVVMQDNLTNRPRGFGFITFDSEESVENVTRRCFHELGGKLAEVKRAVPKDEVIANDGGLISRVENGMVGSFADHQTSTTYIPYPVYTPITTGYGETFGYPYFSPIPFTPIGGFYSVNYEVANVGSSTPLMIPSPSPPFALRGTPMPYSNISTFYQPYLNGLCNGFSSLGLYKDFTGFANGGGQANVPSVQITEIESNGGSSISGMGR